MVYTNRTSEFFIFSYVNLKKWFLAWSHSPKGTFSWEAPIALPTRSQMKKPSQVGGYGSLMPSLQFRILCGNVCTTMLGSKSALWEEGSLKIQSVLFAILKVNQLTMLSVIVSSSNRFGFSWSFKLLTKIFSLKMQGSGLLTTANRGSPTQTDYPLRKQSSFMPFGRYGNKEICWYLTTKGLILILCRISLCRQRSLLFVRLDLSGWTAGSLKESVGTSPRPVA